MEVLEKIPREERTSVDLKTMLMGGTSNASSAIRHILAIPPYILTRNRSILKAQMEK